MQSVCEATDAIALQSHRWQRSLITLHHCAHVCIHESMEVILCVVGVIPIRLALAQRTASLTVCIVRRPPVDTVPVNSSTLTVCTASNYALP